MTLKAVRVNDVSSFPFDPGVKRQLYAGCLCSKYSFSLLQLH